MSFYSIFEGFLTDLRDALLNKFLVFFDELMGNLLYATFFLESLPGLDETILTADTVTAITYALYAIMVILLIIKILKTGGSIYILWRDGDPENSPGEMVVGGGMAIIVAVAFPILYQYGVKIIQWIITLINEVAGTEISFGNSVGSIVSIIGGVVELDVVVIALSLAFIILFIVMLFTMLKQGAEMLLFRLAVPFAAIGLTNSDGGAWKPFIQTLFRMMATSLVRYALVSFSIRVIVPMNAASLAVGIALMATAISTPQILQQFMLQRSGGGAMQKVSTLSMVIRTFMR